MKLSEAIDSLDNLISIEVTPAGGALAKVTVYAADNCDPWDQAVFSRHWKTAAVAVVAALRDAKAYSGAPVDISWDDLAHALDMGMLQEISLAASPKNIGMARARVVSLPLPPRSFRKERAELCADRDKPSEALAAALAMAVEFQAGKVVTRGAHDQVQPLPEPPQPVLG